jgi:hypothetical protein
VKRTPSAQVRLYGILARRSPVAVIFRRGPSKHVLVMKWDTSTDRLEYGQWFKGRIYERRCDLSADGDLLLYFAANYKEPLQSWSAISRPPYLTAIAMWPKGDGWGGGGHFISQNRIALNHRDGETTLAAGFKLPRRIRVEQFGERPGWGEDDPIWFQRLERDGWKLTSIPEKTKDDFGAKVSREFDPPIKWQKANPKFPKLHSLEMAILGIHERDGPWYLIEHSIIAKDGHSDRLGRSDWADWSHSGDLLFGMDGCLYRLTCNAGKLAPLEEAKRVADLSNLRFENRDAPYGPNDWNRK